MKSSCGATRLGACAPAHAYLHTLTLLTKGRLRLAYLLQLALKRPFGIRVHTALPPTAALCDFRKTLTYAPSTVYRIKPQRGSFVKTLRPHFFALVKM